MPTHLENLAVPVGSRTGFEGVEHSYTLETWWRLMPADLECADRIDSVAAGYPRNAWIWSETPGTGKTGLAIALAFHRRRMGANVTILRAPDVSNMRFDRHEDVIASVRDCDVLIWDDATRYRFDQPVLQDLFHNIVDRMYRRRRAVYVTAHANLESTAAMAGAYLAATFDRLNEGGIAELRLPEGSKRG